jgi:surface polysaccharide O-acyltransferase-like enzyme
MSTALLDAPARLATAVRRAAEETPRDRDRYLDLLRGASIVVVVLGHWLMAVVWLAGGKLHATTLLVESPAARWLTWILQVMPLFFVVGGAVGVRSWRSSTDGWATWMRGRAARLLRPVTVLVWAWVAISVAASLAGVDGQLLRLGSQAALVPLWFLSVYLAVVALTPLLAAAHKQLGLALPVMLTAAAGTVDALHLAGVGAVGWLNFVTVWSTCYVLGFAWADGKLYGPARWWLPLVGLGGLIVLVSLAGYPVSMVGVDGATRSNNSPPSMALALLGWAQTGAVLALAGPARRWLQRPSVWRRVVALNVAAMTVYLWHLTVMVLVVGALTSLGGLPRLTPLTAAWWATRPVWVGALAVLLVPLVAVLSPIELSTPRPSRVRRRGETPAIAGAVIAAVVAVAWLVVQGAADPWFTLVIAVVITGAARVTGAWKLRRNAHKSVDSHVT